MVTLAEMHDRIKAQKFLASERGLYIVGQALTVAIETMEKVEPEYMREVSNIEDMRFLRDNLFPTYHEIQQAVEKMTSTGGGV